MGGFRRWKKSSLAERDDRSSRDEGARSGEILRKERERGGWGANGNLGDSKFVVAEKAGELPRDEEARRGDILRIER